MQSNALKHTVNNESKKNNSKNRKYHSRTYVQKRKCVTSFNKRLIVCPDISI